ncbi:MAG: adenylate/guanylate cyclase domain-containing protein [Pseudohongiellaceae bacterium]
MIFRRTASRLPGPMALTLRLSPGLARVLVLAVAAVVTLAVLTLFGDAARIAEERVGNQAWLLASEREAEQRVTVIAIDEKSIAEIGPWPWSRETLAELSTALREAGAQQQLYDIVFPETREGDAAFAAALQSGNAVLAQTPVLGAQQTLQAGTLTHPVGGVNCSNLTATPNYVANHGGLASVPKGHITPLVASDGGVRQVPALLCINGDAYPALALSALLTATATDASGRTGWTATLQPGDGLLEPAQFLTLPAYPGLRVPLDEQGNLRVSYERHPDSYRGISAIDVLNGDFDPAMLDNTWALVGATAFGLGDIVPTPYSGAAPGVELQARLIGSLLDNNVPYVPQGAGLLMTLFSLAAAGLLLVLASFRERLALYGLPAAAVVLPLAAVSLHMQLLIGMNLWLGWLAPAVFGSMAASLLAILEHSRVRLEHDRVYGNLNSYLPADVAREIAYTAPSSEIHARRLNVTLLSADLRNFSAYTEARPPEESAALLHYFFTLATDLIERYEGRVHEFKGDGLLAVFTGDPRGAQQALKAAEALQVAIHRDMLPAHAPAGLEPLDLGIGIEQGPALMGSIGPAQRRTHTLLGDTVTIALRIQEMTAELALPVLVGEGAAAELGEDHLQSQGRYLLSGLKVPHTLFSPAVPESQKTGTDGEGPALKVVSGGRQD